MIGCFPKPYPDELFYSICARFSDRMRYSKKNAVIRDLFAKNVVSAAVDLPTCLDALVSNLPIGHKYTADKFIDSHTLLPFYGPFISPERRHHLREDMHGESGQGLHMRIGITAHPVPLPEYLRFCALCAEEDRKTVGEYYWHRIHQVPGVLVCPTHQVFIQDSNILIRDIAGRRVFIPAQQAIAITPPEGLDLSNLCHIALLKVVGDVDWLLNQSNHFFEGKARHQQYIYALKEHGIVTHQGLVRMSKLLQSFKAYYPLELLSLLHCELGEDIEENWLARLVRLSDAVSSIQHPLHHLLLMQFLGYTAEKFFASHPGDNYELLASKRHPFGKGPWPCLNAASSHYREPLISVCQISYNHRRERQPRGIFACECGFIYSRIGPDRSKKDRFLIGKMKAFGPIWERALQEQWEDKEVSLDKIASRLGVTRPTVKAHAAQLGLASRKNQGDTRQSQWIRVPKPLQEERIEERKQTQRDTYRAAWLAMMYGKVEPDHTFSRKEMQIVRKWLSKNDTEWLKVYPYKARNSFQQPRVDWLIRDKRLAEEVRTIAVDGLKKLPGRPIHISINAIRRGLGKTAVLLNHLERLPLTSEVLAEVVESYEQWGIRRIWWAAELYHQEQIYPTQGQLVRRAHVEYHYYANLASVKEALDAALQTFSRERY